MKRLGSVAFALLAAACLSPREPSGREDGTCTACHGDAARAGDALTRAAPPKDLHGNVETRFPGVGAHQRHLDGSALFPKVACATCHPVPDRTIADGHDDGRVQVLVTSWSPLTATCSGGTCHTKASGEWTRPRPTDQACGSCHGVPPPAPHPQAGSCESCHGPLSAATHLDGVVTRVAERCDACHGSDATGAPPKGLDGGTSSAQRGVGAHQAHLAGGAASRPVPCEGCHEVPAMAVTVHHPNGGPAEVKADAGFDLATGTCRNACHLQQQPGWTQSGPLSCTGCHGQPPAYPHPQLTDCAVCHPSGRALHVDGTVEAAVPQACDGCHGSAANPAPPRDLDGGTSTARRGVGAHQAHLVGRGLARPVTCDECHAVPAQVRSAGHLDGVVQVRFSGVAVNGALTPSYAGGSCASTACHDLSGYTGGASAGGSTPAPAWTQVDGGQATCTSCHGQPPPAPHVARSDCGTCHRLEPALHVNGHLDFQP
ncbi:MAG: hypothetical protein IPJ65_04455 [Archangiaceae bacterium]|nr:hypothetical protein [Archangiaceae bacterium]